MSARDEPFEACKSHRILHNSWVRDGVSQWLLHLLVSGFHFARDDAVAKTVVVLVVLVTLHDKHFEEGHFFSKAVIKVLEGRADRPGSHKRLRGAMATTTILRSAPCEVLKVHRRRASFFSFSLSSATGAAPSTRRGPPRASVHFVFTDVSLDIASHHLVENRGGDVLKGLAQRGPHLVLNLPLEEVVETLALLNIK